MFNKEEKQTKEAETIIGASVKVKGAFVSKGDIIVDGEFEGSLETTCNIHLGEASIITANIQATNGVIHGKLLGNIKIKEKLEIGKNAVINGDIECSNIAISSGAVINGKVSMSQTQQQDSAQ